MNRIWSSIVGKLWATILLLVSFVLFIVTALLLEFLDDFHTQQAEDSLRRDATTIGKIVVDHESESSMALIIEDILGLRVYPAKSGFETDIPSAGVGVRRRILC